MTPGRRQANACDPASIEAMVPALSKTMICCLSDAG
jgi:hypothetical protein